MISFHNSSKLLQLIYKQYLFQILYINQKNPYFTLSELSDENNSNSLSFIKKILNLCVLSLYFKCTIYYVEILCC